MPDLCALLSRLDELLSERRQMAVIKRLAEECLADDKLGHVDALQWPTDPQNELDWTVRSIDRERGLVGPSLTPGQQALILAAFHAAHFPHVEPVVRSDTRRWIVICDRARQIGEFCAVWLQALVRRFEVGLAGIQPTNADELAAPAELADGPFPPNRCRWRGETHELPPIPWLLLKALWHHDTRPVADVVPEVWGEDKGTDGAIKSALAKMNSRLAEAGIPVAWGMRAGHFVKH